MVVLDKVLERIAAWWNREMIDRACVAFWFPRTGVTAGDINRKSDAANALWPSPDAEPDLERLVDALADIVDSRVYCGEAIPTIEHSYGSRGTPMTAAHYLGGNVGFTPASVWVSPVVERWADCDFRFDPSNPWWQRSCMLFGAAVEKACAKGWFASMPDFGDALTSLSLLRGTERLLFDVVDNKEDVVRARDRFLEAWPRFHDAHRKEYARRFPGDMSWLTWAPGRTYPCQCDFGAMLSPALFAELVVPEMEKMDEYLEYIAWHLDGPEEIRHLETLLDLPQIKAIQWVPGAGRPTAVHWLPMLKRIQQRGKSLYVFAESEREVATLLGELSPKGLFISGGFTGGTIEEAEGFLAMVERLSVAGSHAPEVLSTCSPRCRV